MLLLMLIVKFIQYFIGTNSLSINYGWALMP